MILKGVGNGERENKNESEIFAPTGLTHCDSFP